jgi:hypothetical protein
MDTDGETAWCSFKVDMEKTFSQCLTKSGKEVMKFQSQLFAHKFCAIGNMFNKDPVISSSDHQDATSSFLDILEVSELAQAVES